MSFFRKAERKKAKLRLALCGPSGSGKTYSALQLAKGLGGKVAMIDTERGSGDLYAHLSEYETCSLNSPFTPARFIHLIKEAEKAGFDVLIIDSLSHAWAGEGGVLSIHDSVTNADKAKNSWAAWSKVTPQHNNLMDAILQSNMHIITCMRTKTSWTTVEENGKTKPLKLGLEPIQKNDIEFEFTVVLDLNSEGNSFSSSKDRTGVFLNEHGVISPEHGQKLNDWLNSGKPIEEQYQEVFDKINSSTSMAELKIIFDSIKHSTMQGDYQLLENLTKLKDEKKQYFISQAEQTNQQNEETKNESKS